MELFYYINYLPYRTTIIYFLVISFFWVIFANMMSRNIYTKRCLSIISGVLCFIWLLATLEYTVFGRIAGQCEDISLIPVYDTYRLHMSGMYGILRTTWMNVVLFLPYGILLPEAFDGLNHHETTRGSRRRQYFKVVLIALVLSVGIEMAQWIWSLGFAQIDDVICNTAGAVIGGLVYRTRYYFLRRNEESDTQANNES